MQDKAFGRLLGVTVTLHLIFAVWPQIDILVSRWFLNAQGAFWLAGNAATEDMRHLIWFASLVCAVLAVAMLFCTLALGERAQTPWRFWAFVTTLYVLGPGLLVNFILKAHWGRARPSDITAFGGTHQFTPPFEMTDQCLRNCSFVSGEAAAAAVLALVIGLIVVDRAPPLRRSMWIVALIGLFVCVAGQRVASGRHFLSDVTFAGLFMLMMARMLYMGFRVRPTGGMALLASMRADVTAALQPVLPAAASFVADVKDRLAR